MIKQTTPYSCGAASVLAINNILGVYPELTEKDLIKALNAKPEVGVCNERLIEYCQSCYGDRVISYGENSYHGGLAIANIRNWRDGIGHFVVFIKKVRDSIFIFDPFDGNYHMRKFSDLDFVSSCGNYRNFSINFSDL